MVVKLVEMLVAMKAEQMVDETVELLVVRMDMLMVVNLVDK